MKKTVAKLLVSFLAVKGWKLKLVLFVFNIVWDKLIHPLLFRKKEYDEFHKKRAEVKNKIQQKVLEGAKFNDVRDNIKQLYPLRRKYASRLKDSSRQ